MSTRWGNKVTHFNRNYKDLWEYCLAKKITLTGEHFPGFLIQTTDWESRNVSTKKYIQLQTEPSDIYTDGFAMGSSRNGLDCRQTEC